MRSRNGFRFGAMVCLAWACLAFIPAHGAKAAKGGPSVGPGPLQITPEEASLTARPEDGVEHAVILSDETIRNDTTKYSASETAHHFRAKILSPEGRDLGNLELPWNGGDSKLKSWWGRTLLPDGSVLELSKAELERQTLAEARGVEVEAVRATLPGVVPGCVIDYGYVIRSDRYADYDRVRVQRQWPVLNFMYHWKPTRFYQGAYRTSRSDQVDLQVEVAGGAVTLIGHNIPPVTEEPEMPPPHESRASVILYYVPVGTDFETYWEDMAKVFEQVIKNALGKKKFIREALEIMDLPAEGSLDDRLKAAYAWIGDNIKRSDIQMFEELEKSTGDEDHGKNLLRELLSRRVGSSMALQILLIGVARELGAEANLVLAADRTVTYFDVNLRSMQQIDATLVAVSPKGSPGSAVVLDPGSGLPYGEVPWWFSGSDGIYLSGKESKEIALPPTQVKYNISRNTVEIGFEDDNEIVTANWTTSEAGQRGLSARRYLRRLAPEDRQEQVENWCGSGPELDLLEAEVEGIEDLGAPVLFRCEAEQLGTATENIGRYVFPWNGPWMIALPDVPAGERVHPMVFEFPRVEMTQIAVHAPDGFKPSEPPEEQSLESPFGKYTLSIMKDADGFQIVRGLALYQIIVGSKDYGTFREFIEGVRRLDRTAVEFRREGGR